MPSKAAAAKAERERCLETPRICGPCVTCGQRQTAMHLVDASGLYCGACCLVCALRRDAS